MSQRRQKASRTASMDYTAHDLANKLVQFTSTTDRQRSSMVMRLATALQRPGSSRDKRIRDMLSRLYCS